MADNVQLKDAFDDVFWARTKDIGGSNGPLHAPVSVPFDQFGVPLFTPSNPGVHAEIDAVVAASFSRPANSTPYAIGNLIANSTVAGSVVPLALPVGRIAGGSCRTNRARLTKTGVATANAIFRAHLYKILPTPSHGDGAAWLTDQALAYFGSFTFDMTGANARVFTDGVKIIATPDVGAEQIIETAQGTNATRNVFALLEARAVYVPASGETFTLALEVKQN